MIIIGDFCHLPPVGDRALFNTDTTNANNDTLNAQRLYRRFNQIITLTQVMRQQGMDTESVAFRQALTNLRMNRVTVKDWQLLTSRVQAKVMTSGEDLSAWTDAPHINQKREEV